MKNWAKYALTLSGVTLTVLITYRYAFAADTDPASHVTVIMKGLGDRPSLVAFDLGGANGVERTVLVNSTIVAIGGKRFLGGTVTDKYPEIKVVSPGTGAYIALDRIVYIQYLDNGNRKDGS